MCKVTLSCEDGDYNTCLVSKETPEKILRHFHINPNTKIVYMNGKILSKDEISNTILETGTVHLSVKNKTVTR
jgi:sulfur carrier protein ThiS